MKEEDKKKLQEKYIELQLVSAQIKQVEEQLSVLDQKAAEIFNLKQSMKNFSKLKQGTKSFAPLGQGIFTESVLGPTDAVLINVGAGVVVKKSISEAESTIAAQMDQVEKLTVELGENLKSLAAKAHQIELEIDKLS